MKLIKIFLLLFLAVKVFAADPMDFNDKFREHSKKFSDNNSSVKQNDKLQKSTDDKMNEKLSATKLEKNTTKELRDNSITDINSKMTESLNRKSAAKPVKKKYKKGYVEVKKGGNYYHISVPQSYSPEKKMPLLIALHRESGTGEEFMPQLQINVDKDMLIICPDSSDHFTWSTEDNAWKNNIEVIDTAIRIMERQYNVDEDKVYLLGYEAGGIFALRLTAPEIFYNMQSKKIIKKLKGIIIAGAEAKIELENYIWPIYQEGKDFIGKYKNVSRNQFKNNTINTHRLENEYESYKNLEFFILGSRSDYKVPISSVRYTKNFLRESGYKVRYVEGEWEGYPVGYNKEIFDWCCSSEKKYTDTVNKVEKSKVGVTGQVKIYEIMRDRVNVRGLIEKYRDCAVNANSKNPLVSNDTKQLRTTLIDTRYDFMLKINRDVEPLNGEKIYNDIRIVFLGFNKDKDIVGGKEWRYGGFDPGDKSIRDYLKERYHNISYKPDKMIELENSLRRGVRVGFHASTPVHSENEYACVMVYKGGFLAGFRMYPDGTDHSEFPDLEHIVLKNDY